MMPSSRWLQLSYVCGSYDKVFLLVLLGEGVAANAAHGFHRLFKYLMVP